jgi:hypothetical protein
LAASAVVALAVTAAAAAVLVVWLPPEAEPVDEGVLPLLALPQSSRRAVLAESTRKEGWVDTTRRASELGLSAAVFFIRKKERVGEVVK